MKKILEFICPHIWDYTGAETRKCRICKRKEHIGLHTEIVPCGLCVVSVKTNRWMKDQ